MLEFAQADAMSRLRAMVASSPPAGGLEPAYLHLGEQRLAIPTALLASLEGGDAWSRYPLLGGTAELRDAYAGWLTRQFDIGDALARGLVRFEPSPGSKQAIASALMLAVACARAAASGVDPAVVVPDMGYPTYRAAATAARARVITYDPELERPGPAVSAALGEYPGPLAAIVISSPGNPTGHVLSADAQHELARLARDRGALLLVDECYVDLWLDRPVIGALQLSVRGALPCSHLVLHTLSKRSGAPGLRSGFVAGDARSVGVYAAFNRTCGVSLPGPVSACSAALWRDDEHVVRVRAALRSAWRTADEILNHLPGYRRAPAGFFLWLPVRDSLAAARALWERAAVLTLPGEFLAESAAATHRLRIALVHPDAILAPALTRLCAVLEATRQYVQG